MEDWKKYERFVAYLCSEEFLSDDVTVIPNAKLTGSISKCERQVDVLIDSRFEDGKERRIIVDAKRYKRAINVKDVESFEGMMRDCSASKGILVCPNGYSESAKRRAQGLISIRLVTLEELEKLDLSLWSDCLSESCNSRKNRGLVLWDAPFGIGSSQMPLSICCVAKCDECGDFHVWCWSCGQRFSLTNEDEHKCNCDTPWFWLTAIEENDDENSGESVYLLLPHLTDVLVVDRKPLQ
ncbi:restriction endonuclease [Photobacterium sp.]|uniref:restriction endonuclease n=1 Tax=Photobacterium sp. TaxID=660 RepID=UPI00299EE330|nr:restriction endonuclease [Photobacterium sp.]MDX1300914.1 restriction endonuclease [Photobacterium sp.]